MGKINDYSLLPSIEGYEDGRLVIETPEGTRTTTPEQITRSLKDELATVKNEIEGVSELIGSGVIE